jgi:hypothetical protein
MGKHITPMALLNKAIKKKHAKRINALLFTASDKEFAMLYFKLLPHVLSKLKRIEYNSQQPNNKINISISHTKDMV